MIQRGSRHRLKAQPFSRVLVSASGSRQQLDSDYTIEPWIARTLNFAHAALANRIEDFVRTKASSSS
jgi:hypothetical protein